jgi:hypothetical protein
MVLKTQPGCREKTAQMVLQENSNNGAGRKKGSDGAGEKTAAVLRKRRN